MELITYFPFEFDVYAGIIFLLIFMLELYSPYLLDWGEHFIRVNHTFLFKFSRIDLELFWSMSYSESETNDEDLLLLDESSLIQQENSMRDESS